MEDLHWADPSSLELLTRFLDQVPTTRLLAVLTYRPEFIPPWGSHPYLSQLMLSRLGRSQVETMVERVTGGKALPAEVVQQIASKWEIPKELCGVWQFCAVWHCDGVAVPLETDPILWQW